MKTLHTATPELIKQILELPEAKGIFTVKSMKSGKDYTYKIKRSEFNNKIYTHVYVETGYLHFRHLGIFTNNTIIKKGKEIISDSAKALKWTLNSILNNNPKIDQIKIYHLGKCCKCGRQLTDAKSIETGFGPHCRKQ